MNFSNCPKFSNFWNVWNFWNAAAPVDRGRPGHVPELLWGLRPWRVLCSFHASECLSAGWSGLHLHFEITDSDCVLLVSPRLSWLSLVIVTMRCHEALNISICLWDVSMESLIYATNTSIAKLRWNLRSLNNMYVKLLLIKYNIYLSPKSTPLHLCFVRISAKTPKITFAVFKYYICR